MNEIGGSNNASAEQSRYADLKSSTIMLVDDEPVMLEIVQALLEEEGYQRFVSVENSTLAMDTLVKNDPDILLLDLDMPEVNGFEVLSTVRAHDDYKYLPVIILTASEDPDSKLKALEMGATDFLSKPVDPSELALRVRNTLSAKAYQDQLAYYDNVTGLPNRKLFIDRLGRGLEWAKREQHPVVLLDVGLDRFRSINETLGLSTGDYILRTIAERLKTVVRGSDSVGHGEKDLELESLARIGGDEFSIMLFAVNSVENASIVSKRVLKAINKPIKVGGDEIYLRANIGISVYPQDGEDVESIIKHAGSAKDFSQQLGADNYQYYSSEMNAHSRAVMKMEFDLRKALENNEFELYYQPQIDIKSGRVMGMESLIRWFHPELGLIPPVKFIPVAEELGLIVSIGEWVLHEACNKASAWINEGFSDLKVSVNVSVQQFRDAGFKDSIISALQSSQLNPQNLVLEITESMLMGDVDHYVSLLHDIKQLGVSFSLDDFGTGYSSLSYLKRFPICELKIDRSFLLEVPSSNDDCAIVRAIIAMAHSLGQLVVAEGVEEVEQLNFLKQHGCNVIQGYYFSKPLNQSDFSSYLSSSASPHSSKPISILR